MHLCCIARRKQLAAFSGRSYFSAMQIAMQLWANVDSKIADPLIRKWQDQCAIGASTRD